MIGLTPAELPHLEVKGPLEVAQEQAEHMQVCIAHYSRSWQCCCFALIPPFASFAFYTEEVRRCRKELCDRSHHAAAERDSLQAGRAQDSSRTADSMQSLGSTSGQAAAEASHDSAAPSNSQTANEHMQAVKVTPCRYTVDLSSDMI